MGRVPNLAREYTGANKPRSTSKGFISRVREVRMLVEGLGMTGTHGKLD